MLSWFKQADREPGGLYQYFLLGGSVPAFVRQHGLGRGEAGDRHAVGRAGDVIEPDRLAKADRGRVAAMLAANPELKTRPRGASALRGDADELADPLDVEGHKRVVLEDPEPLIGADKARRIVARQAEDGLRQVIGAKAEEFGALGDLAGAQRRPRQFDHR